VGCIPKSPSPSVRQASCNLRLGRGTIQELDGFGIWAFDKAKAPKTHSLVPKSSGQWEEMLKEMGRFVKEMGHGKCYIHAVVGVQNTKQSTYYSVDQAGLIDHV
jgi:hypothetical protein